MDSYTLNTVNYNYKTLSHEGFGGVCKYIATPKRVGYSRLLVKHEKIQSCQRRDKNDVNRRSENDRNAEIVSPR